MVVKEVTARSTLVSLIIFGSHFVIAGELEGSWRAGGQQEGLQYSREVA
jgi:hypothetical protein